MELFDLLSMLVIGGTIVLPSTYRLSDDSTARAVLVDRLDAIDPAAADSALSAARIAALDRLINDLTAARAAFLDAAISSRASAADYTAARAAFLDAAISSRASAADYTAARAALIDQLGTGGILRAGTTAVRVVRPSAANLAALRSSTDDWVAGAYVEIAAAASLAAHALARIIVRHIATGLQSEIDVATGAAGSEVVAGTVPVPAWSTAVGLEGYALDVSPPIQIGANARVAMRIRKNSGGANVGVDVKAEFVPRPF